MFENNKDTTFYLCQYNFDMKRWEWTHRFENEEELIAYLASYMKTTYGYWDEEGKPHKPIIESSLSERMNYSGKDTGVSMDYIYFRDIMIVDGHNRIINTRIFDEKAKRVYQFKQRRPYAWWRNTVPAHKFRREPVPHTGSYYGKYGRNVKHWFKSYMQDRIPEHKPYVRKKAMVPNTWITEPTHHFEKSWKHQTKCRHQWEKNLRKET